MKSKQVVVLIAVAATLVGCAVKGSPTQAPMESKIGTGPATPIASSPQTPAVRTGSVQINGVSYTVEVPDGASDKILAQGTDAGVAWVAPQKLQGEGVQQHPIEPATLWLTPFRQGGGNLAEGSRKLFTFPLTVPYQPTGADQYVLVSQIAPAGNWVAVMLSLRMQGAGNGSGQLVAVNLQTGSELVVTDAHFNGGQHFYWRAAPGHIYWEQQSLTASGEPTVVASKVIDLETNKVSDVPPGTAGKQ
jgi:hypothetical protein